MASTYGDHGPTYGDWGSLYGSETGPVAPTVAATATVTVSEFAVGSVSTAARGVAYATVGSPADATASHGEG